jgi:hypothetical protein
MATLLGKAQITTIDGGTLYMTAAAQTATAKPNLQSGSLTHTGDVKETKNQSGQVTSLFNAEEYLACDFEMVPEGGAGAANTIANAKVSATLPAILSAVTMSGFAVVGMGSFSDALNVNSTGTNPWIYEGNGKINLVSDDKWTMSVELKRRIGITSGTAVT